MRNLAHRPHLRIGSGLLYIAVASLCGALSSAMILAQLGAVDSGKFFLAQSIVAIALLLDFGLQITGTREFAFATGRSQVLIANHAPIDVYGSLINARRISIASLSVAIAISLLCVITLKGDLRSLAESVALGSTAALLSMCAFSYQSVLEGGGNYHIERAAQTLTVLLTTASTVTGAWLYHSFTAAAAAWLTSLTLALFAKRVITIRFAPYVAADYALDLTKAAQMLRKSASICVVQVGAVLTKNIQFPIVASSLGLATLGPYFFVARIIQAVDSAISVLAASDRALFSTAIGAGRLGEARSMMLSSIGKIAAALLVAAIGISLALPFVLGRIMPDKDWTRIPFALMAVDMVAICLAGNMSQFVVASGRNPFARTVFIQGALTTALLFLMIPRFGIVGAALAQFLGNLAISGWYAALHFFRLSTTLGKLQPDQPDTPGSP